MTNGDLQRVQLTLTQAQNSLALARMGTRDVGTLMADTCAALIEWLAYQVEQERQKQDKGRG